MNADDSRLRRLPVLRELFLQWCDARGAAAPGEFQKPFSREWESLLTAAGLTSAEARHESDRDARLLADAGLVRLKTAKYRAYQIERILVPLEAEPKLRVLFADELPPPPDVKFDPANVTWAPKMSFVTTVRLGIAPEDLIRLNEFFLNGGSQRPLIPVKERSLQIFGDEKRLDALRTTALFKGRLTLESLRCFVVAEPLGWQRGPDTSGPLLVIENAATWDSYCRWNRERAVFSAVVYGCGNRFADGVARLADIFAELGGSRRVLYFGDLDPQGLRIPQLASRYATSENVNLPPIDPHLWSYRELLSVGRANETVWDGEPAMRTDCDWLGELADIAWDILSRNKRLAQEHIGWEFLISTDDLNDGNKPTHR
jgi:hypothetical protein